MFYGKSILNTEHARTAPVFVRVMVPGKFVSMGIKGEDGKISEDDGCDSRDVKWRAN